MPITFYLARHGQSFGNLNGDMAGGDPELTPLGLEQAEKLIEKFADIPLNAVYASTRIRTQQTAKPVATHKKLPIQVIDHLKERFFGSLEEKTGEEIMKLHGDKYRAFDVAPFEEQMHWKLVEDEETFAEVMDRVVGFMNTFEHDENEQHILLVSHANVLVPMLVHLGFASFKQLPNGSIQNTSFIKILKDDEGIKLLGVDGITKTE